MKFLVYLILLMSVVIIGGAVLLLLRVVFAGASTYIKTPVQKNVKARVISKRKQDMLRASGPYTNYYILFDLGNNDKLEFSVGKHLYKKCNSEDKGSLSFKGGIFISFTLDKDLPPPPPKKETYILNGEVVEK